MSTAVWVLAVSGVLAAVAVGLWWRDRTKERRAAASAHAEAFVRATDESTAEVLLLESWLALDAVTPEHEGRP